jgi:hypothetical protein
MDAIVLKLVLLAAAGIGLLTFVTLMTTSYRRYYKRMKELHGDEWLRLMNKDKLIADFGAWTRWPIGSSYFMLSIMKRHVTYGDDEISLLKHRFFWGLLGFSISFLSFLLLVALLPYAK